MILDINQPLFPVVLRKYSLNRNVTWGGVLSTAGITKLNIGIKDSISNDHELALNFSLPGAKIGETQWVTIDREIHKQKNIDAVNFAVRSGNVNPKTLTVIVGIIQSDTLKYDFSNSNMGKQKLNVNLGKIAELGQNVKWNNASSSFLDYAFNTPVTCFYKLLSISFAQSFVGDPGLVVGKVPVSAIMQLKINK